MNRAGSFCGSTTKMLTFIARVLEEEKEESGAEKVLREIMAEEF